MPRPRSKLQDYQKKTTVKKVTVDDILFVIAWSLVLGILYGLILAFVPELTWLGFVPISFSMTFWLLGMGFLTLFLKRRRGKVTGDDAIQVVAWSLVLGIVYGLILAFVPELTWLGFIPISFSMTFWLLGMGFLDLSINPVDQQDGV